jgi:hypothetical protein
VKKVTSEHAITNDNVATTKTMQNPIIDLIVLKEMTYA